MKEKLFELVSKHKGYALFEKIVELVDKEKFNIEKEIAIGADNNLTLLINIINNAGWDTPENHSRVIDIIKKSSILYDKYLEKD